MAWHSFMAIATSNPDIPTIPGLEPHPAQIQERNRVAALRQLEPQAGPAAAAEPAATRSQMSDRTRQALRQLGEEMRLATERPDGIGAPRPAGSAPAPGTTKPPPAPGRRAEPAPAPSERLFEPASAVRPPPGRER
jgi:penicillin-binding protein 1A